jgi:hypothetical protein
MITAVNKVGGAMEVMKTGRAVVIECGRQEI